MTYEELYYAAETLVDDLLADADLVRGNAIGLDDRAAYSIWIPKTRDMIIVRKAEDGRMQYYGGFEYVDKSCRMELGGYVIYSSEDDRVARHLSYLAASGEPEEEEGDEICGQCNGSGEGMYDGSRCSACGGSGVEGTLTEEDREDALADAHQEREYDRTHGDD